MSKQITITVPDGYDQDLSHLVLVSTENRNVGRFGAARPIYAAIVLDAVTGEEIEEVGEGSLTEIMIDSARVIRTGTAAQPGKES